ncbi:dethiobiotin synthase [Aestuariibacter sp. A3R04]|uniref:dethiobiotin synthase n=1 Tax=Aestuariibacter sp. A3R04 TaxID=2841571 RepID=UPI001C0A0457|nr:dethiobiotin synthase [Aestuariibacter sp. A3R04]MBU3022480.1 dethiobiotin synthase [Aestuariibacter sp. A3R04]
MSVFFVTGTDTEVGKTYVSSLLLQAAASVGKRTVGYKPVSAGCEFINGEWSNEDARALQNASSIEVSLQDVNPIALKPPIAPHIAAKQAGLEITQQNIIAGFEHLVAKQPDFMLVEGAGGWRLPLSSSLWMPEVVKALKLDVIVVVGMRLGCLNHAMLTIDAIQRDGLKVKGWVANQLSAQMPVYQDNLNTLKGAISAPLIAEIPFSQSVEALQRIIHRMEVLA